MPENSVCKNKRGVNREEVEKIIRKGEEIWRKVEKIRQPLLHSADPQNNMILDNPFKSLLDFQKIIMMEEEKQSASIKI